MADLKNKIIGGFQVLQEIQAGSGSQGTVYKAICVDGKDNLVPVGTIVALKVMAVQDEGHKQWKKLEKRTMDLARMSSPNVVRYYGCFSEAGLFNDIHVVVQEFLQGETLKERLVRYPSGLDVDEAVRIADAALSGLVYTSSCGIIHRDIKPGNIFLCDDGSVKLIDFEIAKQNGGTTTSSAGNIRGSFDYMAPDFTNADFHGDVQSDVFSMGVVLHEMLTGKTPYQRLEGDDKQANFAFLSRWAHSLTEGYNPIHVSSRINRLLAHTEELMSRALAPRRENRYSSFAAFRDGLKSVRFRNLRNGQNIYQMLQFIGKGGFGEVFKARLRNTGQLVAVKHLLKANYAERFYREAKIMKKLHDPCFVQFVDFFMMDAGNSHEAFLVMAFLDGMPGSSLRDAIKNADKKRIPQLDIMLAFERYARGLQVMHSEGIFHRDIKPANLYFPEGNPKAAAIMDLGIARDVNGTATHGQVPGTLDYMPPEVVVTDSRGDGGMDIYALGLCFYEALTCKTAFPRLPGGTAAYAEFFERAKTKRSPVFDDPEVRGDRELLALLTEMTNPDLALRMRDAGDVIARIRALRMARFPGSVEERADDSFAGATQEIPSATDAEPVAETVAFDGETWGTVATQWSDGKLAVLEHERKLVQSRYRETKVRSRRTLKVAITVLGILAAIGAGGFFAWNPARSYYAGLKLDEVLNEYRHGIRQIAQRKESAWRTQWDPMSYNWLKLDGRTFFALSKKLEAEKAKIEAVKTEGERKAKVGQDRSDALLKIASCRTADGRLDEENYLRMDGWTLPETVKDDAEIASRLSSMEKCLVAAIKAKLSKEPPLTRDRRIRKAKELLSNSWSSEILTQSEREKLAKEIDVVSAWCVGVVKNNCETEIRLDGRTIAVGGSMVAVYEDGHSENGVITRQGYKSISLPPKLDGRIYEVSEDAFVVKPVEVEFPQLDVGIKCFFNGKEVSSGETVTLDPGNYTCTYRNGNKFQPQTVKFTVRVNVPTVIPEPASWAYTEEFAAMERQRLERERILRETPVEVEIAEFDSDVTLVLDGQEYSSGVVCLKPGKYGYRFIRKDCVDQAGELTVSPGVRTALPGPVRWEKSANAILREKNERLRLERERIFESCRAKLSNEPIETRQSRLAEALKQLTKAVAVDQIMTEDDARGLSADIERRQRWTVGKIQNKCYNLTLNIGGETIAPGETRLLVFEEGLPENWCCKADGYETKKLLRDLDGRTIAIGEDELVPMDVQVSLPDLASDITCHFEGTPVIGMLSLKPGSYSCVYRRKGYEDQVMQFEVQFGKSSMMPIPGGWRALPVRVSTVALPADVSCMVDGAAVGSVLELSPGEHICEFQRIDYKTQTKRFVVAVATPMSLPMVDAWEPSQGLKRLNSAEQYARQKDWSAAEKALADAEVKSNGNVRRKEIITKFVKKQGELKRKAEQAIEYYDGEFYGDAVKYYYEAYKLGYSMTDEDKQRVKYAYEVRRKELKGLIEWTKREIKRGRSVDRSVADLEKDDKELFEWYNAMK